MERIPKKVLRKENTQKGDKDQAGNMTLGQKRCHTEGMLWEDEDKRQMRMWLNCQMAHSEWKEEEE
jgi:hypothetical protein